jgi:glycolate oxidase
LPYDNRFSLEEIVGLNRLLTQLEDLVPYSFEATPALNQLPQAVVFTRTVDEVVAVLKLANETKIPSPQAAAPR